MKQTFIPHGKDMIIKSRYIDKIGSIIVPEHLQKDIDPVFIVVSVGEDVVWYHEGDLIIPAPVMPQIVYTDKKLKLMLLAEGNVLCTVVEMEE